MGTLTLQLLLPDVDAEGSRAARVQSATPEAAAVTAELGLYRTAGPQYPILDHLAPFPQDGRTLQGSVPTLLVSGSLALRRGFVGLLCLACVRVLQP